MVNTEKDKALNKIIAWTDQMGKIEYEMSKLCILEDDADGETWHDGCASAYQKVAERCKVMGGYYRPMTEGENQVAAGIARHI